MSDNAIVTDMVRFLESRRPETLCVSGAWGVGKTYLWTDIVLPQSVTLPSFNGVPDDLKEGQADYQSYSYVSLFGVNGIAELKRAIADARRPRDKWAQPLSQDDLRANWRKNIDFVSRMTGAVMKWGNAAEILASRMADSIWDQLICIDDLERKGAGLSMRDLLGYVVHLKEQRRCKVIVLTNSTELIDADRAQYDEYHEKVFDNTLLFAPTPAVCCDIVKADATLRSKVLSLNISNIRVIKKIQALIERVRPTLADFHPSVMSQAVGTLTLASWMKYTKGAPPFAFLKRRTAVSVAVSMGRSALSGSDTVSDEEVRWANAIDAYGYPYSEPDTLDVALNDATTKGYIDRTLIRAAAKALNRSAESADADALRHAAWELYHGSFKPNEEEVVAALVTSYGDHMQYINASALDGVIGILRALARDAEADALISNYLSTHAGNPKAFDPKWQRYPTDEPIKDARLHGIIQDTHSALSGPVDPIAALKKLQKQGGGDEDDYKAAMQVTVEQLVNAFDVMEGDAMNSFIRACQKYEVTFAYGLQLPLIAQTTREALTIIGQRSALNKLRIRKFGVDLAAASLGPVEMSQNDEGASDKD